MMAVQERHLLLCTLVVCSLLVCTLLFRQRALSTPSGSGERLGLRTRFEYPEHVGSHEPELAVEDGHTAEPLLPASLFAMHAAPGSILRSRLAQPPSIRPDSKLSAVVSSTNPDPPQAPPLPDPPQAPPLPDSTQDPPLLAPPQAPPLPDPPQDPPLPAHPAIDTSSPSIAVPDPAPGPAADTAPDPLPDDDPAPPPDYAASPEAEYVVEYGVTLEPQGFEPAAPWTAPPGTSFPYQGLENDLDGLLQVQASGDKWISIITMSGKIKRFVLNCIYTLHKYGAWPHFILVAFDGQSLQACQQLNLPCFNGRAFATQDIADGDHSYGTGNATEIWWAKQRLALELLRRGYNVHGSDADVVYFRDLHQSYQGLFHKTDADAVFATEEWIRHHYNLINAGVYAVRSNERSVRFFERWTADTELGRGGVDQDKLNRLYDHEFLTCDSMASCKAVQNLGKFSVFRHKSFFPGNYCIEDSLHPEPCDTRRMYLHQLCIHGWPSKTERWDMLNLWFVGEDLRPMFSDGGGAQGAHAFMPCKDQVAWTDVEQGTVV